MKKICVKDIHIWQFFGYFGLSIVKQVILGGQLRKIENQGTICDT
jgi:hypothetical protein